MPTAQSADEEANTQLDDGRSKSKSNTPDGEYQAISVFEKVIGMNGIKPETKARAYELTGCSYLKLKNYHAAIPAFESAVREDPKNITAYISKGRALQKIRQFLPAQIAFQEALSRVKDSEEPKWGTYERLKIYLDVHSQIGVTLSRGAYDEEAINCFTEAEDFEKTYDYTTKDPAGKEKEYSERCRDILYSIRISKCLSQSRLGWDSAKDLATMIIEELKTVPVESVRKKNLVRAYIVLSEIYLESSPSDGKALPIVDKAIGLIGELDKGLKSYYFWSAYLNKGLLLRKLKKYDEAVQCFSEGISRYSDLVPNTNVSLLKYNRGLTYIDMQEFDKGIRELTLLQKSSPQCAEIDIALSDAFHNKALREAELEFQHSLREKFKTSVETTETNLQVLSNDINISLKFVAGLFYILFIVGMGIFLGAFAWTIANASNIQTNPFVPAIGIIGGIDVILSMMLLSPAKIQKNRIDYSQWLMGYYNWLNTEFVAGMIVFERLSKMHSPNRTDADTLDWQYVKPMYKFLHTMTKDTMETIDKCCEFPDVPYSLSKKSDGSVTSKTDTSKQDGKGSSVSASDSSDGSPATSTAGSSAKSQASAVQAGGGTPASAAASSTGKSSGDTSGAAKKFPGTILSEFVREDVPAIALGIWQGNLVDASYNSNLTSNIVGLKPEPFDQVTVADVSKGKQIYFTVKGYKSMMIVVGIFFYYLDEDRRFSFAADPDDPKFTLIDIKTNAETIHCYQIESDYTIQKDLSLDAGKYFTDYFELPHRYSGEMDEAPGKHYIRFRIAEGIYESQRKNPKWIWESDMIKFTLTK
nr:tetratricopeptide repeat protein [uncultured Methanoregula sp.]